MNDSEPVSREELLDILEATAGAQLRALRALRHKPRQKAKRTGRANIDVVCDVLAAAPGPLHIDDIIQKANQSYGVKLSRESLVSAITKKVLDQNTFCRTAPNTFDLINRSAKS
jgi:hypothetical protein